ncbi:efflux RND transporter permease subunit, partial [Salmonella enterica subsp. enterica serovar Kentucky]|nr:efflux RND transporter permease subunit [Salmonella enterica subsp. enterica serovar Kentucky]
SYWSGSNSTSLSSGAKLDFYYVVDLADGSRRSENSSPSSVWQVLSAVFIPMAFFGGSTGAIYRQFSITIVSAMALSVLVALILT